MEGPVVVNILNAIVERICGTCLPWLCNATVPQPGGPQTGKASFQTLAQSGARFGRVSSPGAFNAICIDFPVRVLRCQHFCMSF